jgi:hypothetical protein
LAREITANGAPVPEFPFLNAEFYTTFTWLASSVFVVVVVSYGTNHSSFEPILRITPFNKLGPSFLDKPICHGRGNDWENMAQDALRVFFLWC